MGIIFNNYVEGNVINATCSGNVLHLFGVI